MSFYGQQYFYDGIATAAVDIYALLGLRTIGAGGNMKTAKCDVARTQNGG